MVNIKDQEKYWHEHLDLEAPNIDNKLFRIQISGKISHVDLISQLRENFEKSEQRKILFEKRAEAIKKEGYNREQRAFRR